MVKDSKKSSSSAAKVAVGVPTPPVRSSAAEKGTKLRRIAEKNKKKKNKKFVPDTEVGSDDDYEPSSDDDYDPTIHGIHYLQNFWIEKRLPEDSKTLYAYNIYHPEDRKLVLDDFVKFFSDVGKVVKVEMHLDPMCEDFVDFATIEFESHDVAKKAMEEKQLCWFYGLCRIELDGFPKEPGFENKDFTDTRLVIYVTGFAEKVILVHQLHSKLTDYFSACGEVDYVTTPKDGYGFSRGFAFIEFKNDESLQKALKLDGARFLGCRIKVGRSKVFVTSL